MKVKCCWIPASTWACRRVNEALICLKTWSFLVFQIAHNVLRNIGILVPPHPSSLTNLPSLNSSHEAMEREGWSRGATLRVFPLEIALLSLRTFQRIISFYTIVARVIFYPFFTKYSWQIFLFTRFSTFFVSPYTPNFLKNTFKFPLWLTVVNSVSHYR